MTAPPSCAGLPQPPAPHSSRRPDTAALMRAVLYALIPGAVLAVVGYGVGVLANLLLTALGAATAEALCLAARRQPVRAGLADGSALVTAALLALALPPLLPAWLPFAGGVLAVVLGKQAYGGLGRNLFNPALLAYALLYLAAPRSLHSWPAAELSTSAALAWIFGWAEVTPPPLDAWSAATPLAAAHAGLTQHLTWSELSALPAVSGAVRDAGEWIAAGYLAGGLWLWRRGVIGWQIPLAVLAGLTVSALGFYLLDPDAAPPPWFALAAPSSMLVAWFIATEPVTAAATPRGRWWYGVGIGVLTGWLRARGGAGDAAAFAVLIMNLAVPLIERWTPPRLFGHDARS